MTRRRAFDPRAVPLTFWRDSEVQTALAQHDIGALFRMFLAQHPDCTQTQLALLTEHDRSEVSNLVRGSRSGRIGDIDVLTRIADGLQMPDEARVLTGLAPASVLMSSVRQTPSLEATTVVSGSLTQRETANMPVPRLGAPIKEQSQAHSLDSEIDMAAHESREHARHAASQTVDEISIEQVHEDIASIARRYPATPPLESFVAARASRNRALTMLDRTSRPAQETELYLAVGRSCGVLASASFDLGHTDAAAEQARAAFVYGRMIGDTSLCAWALGFRALISNWSGRPLEALELIGKGLALGPDAGTAVGRLHAIAARAHALLGNSTAADEAARHATAAHGTTSVTDDLHDRIGGEFSFDAARIARCLGTAYLQLALAEPAQAQAQRVLDIYAAGPSSNLIPKIETEARIDLCHAHILAGSLDAAEADLTPVFAIAAGRRVHGVTGRLLDVRRALTATPHASSRLAHALGARIEEFTADSARAPQLPGA